MDVKFNKVWYLPSENTWKDFNMLAMKDSGILTINDHSLEFLGKSTKIVIDNIQSVSYGKQGRDFVNNWIKVRYIDENGKPAQAFFADGRLLGWSGVFGGTKRIFGLVKQLEGEK